MRSLNTLLLVVVLSVLLTESASVYKLVKHTADTNARCLDGSPAAAYISQGDADQILVYFEGGGMCHGMTLQDTIQDCLKRSKTNLGSSNNLKPTMDFDDFSVLSNDENANPLYASWTKVYVPYCDGSLHQGSKLSPISYKGSNLYFRGANNTIAQFNYLNTKYNFFNASQIVITGTSAGAMAAVAWGNYVYNRAENKDNVLIICDSGIFVSDFYNPFTNSTPGVDEFKYINQIISTETTPPYEECLKEHEVCTTSLVIKYLRPALFVIQSEYDLYGILAILKLTCPLSSFPASLEKCNSTEMDVIEQYRKKTVDILKGVVEDSKNAVWAISCVQHGFLYKTDFYYSKSYLVPGGTGKSILEVLAGFVMRAGQKVNIDEAAWPNNLGCNGKSGFLKREF